MGLCHLPSRLIGRDAKYQHGLENHAASSGQLSVNITDVLLSGLCRSSCRPSIMIKWQQHLQQAIIRLHLHPAVLAKAHGRQCMPKGEHLDNICNAPHNNHANHGVAANVTSFHRMLPIIHSANQAAVLL